MLNSNRHHFKRYNQAKRGIYEVELTLVRVAEGEVGAAEGLLLLDAALLRNVDSFGFVVANI